jgi:hypothetical protein
MVFSAILNAYVACKLVHSRAFKVLKTTLNWIRMFYDFVFNDT